MGGDIESLELDFHVELNVSGTPILFSGLELIVEEGTHRLLIETQAGCMDHLHLHDLSLLAKDTVYERFAAIVKLTSGFAR